MWAPLRFDLCSAGILDAELFSQQCTLFWEAIVLRRKPDPGIDAVSGPGACVHDAVMRQRESIDSDDLISGILTRPQFQYQA